MDFGNGQNNMVVSGQIKQPQKTGWSIRRPFASRGYSAPSVPSLIQFNGVAKRDDQPQFEQQQYMGGHITNQHVIQQQFPVQQFSGQQFPDQEFHHGPIQGSQFPSQQHFIASNVYADMVSHQNSSLAMHNQEYQDRNETKPRLAKHEVELLERHFQENHKPPSSLKRQLAEMMGVGVARINNWFQNRRAKAKHERKLEAKRLDGDKEADADQSEDFDFTTDFPEGFEEDEEDSFDEPTGGTATSSVHGSTPKDAPPVASHHEDQRSGVDLDRSEFNFNFDQVGQFDQPRVSSSAPSGSFMMPVSSGFPDFQPQLLETNESLANYDEEAFMAQMQRTQDADFTLQSNAGPQLSFPPFPSQLLSAEQQQDSFPMMPSSTNQLATTVEPVQEDMMMRFMSPPPATDIASRRSKRRPAPIGTDAIKDRSTSGVRTPLTAAPQRRVTKSPGTTIRRVSSAGALKTQGGYRVNKSSAHPSQSPLRPNFDFANLSGMSSQVNLVQSNNGGLAPPTPRSPTAQFSVEDNGQHSSAELDYHKEQIAILNNTFWNSHEFYQFSPPETPGHHSNAGSGWSYDVSDHALHTPNFGGFPADPFSLQMHQQNATPSYVANSGGFAPGSLNGHGNMGPQSNVSAGNFDPYAEQLPAPAFFSPQTSTSSVSPLASSDNLTFNNTMFEQQAAETKHDVQYKWDQQLSDLAPPTTASPEQPRNRALVFHHATPKDFQGKPCSGQP